MTHLVIGPGAMGRLVGIRLAAQLPVVLMGRRRLPALQHLTTPEEESLSRSLQCLSLEDAWASDTPIAAIHLMTKAYAADEALDHVASRVPRHTPLVLWQNGFDVQPRLTQRWTGPTLCASTTEGAYRTGEDHIVHAGHGQTWIGHLAGMHVELAESLADTLTSAGLACQPVTDIRTRLWHKLAVNAAINPVVARYQLLNGQLAESAHAPLVNAIIAEVDEVMQAADVPPPEQGLQALVWQVVEGTARNRASMLQDVLAGRPTEHDAILLPLLRVAHEHRLTTPRLAAFHHYFEQRAGLARNEGRC